MPVYLPQSEDIYFEKTREYFKEVISSYAIGNYRSANVMLYSIAICDILFKLQELVDMYNDSVAAEILSSYKINSNQASSKSKSAWEKDFVETVHKKTELLDLEAYTHLIHLYEDRNFSAHPALNKTYELISPSPETTIANIKNILQEILVKPPIFITKVIDTLLKDLDEKSSLFEYSEESLKTYLNNKYFSRMPKSMKANTFRSLWKICFKLFEDDDCCKNRTINRKAIETLTDNPDLTPEEIIKNDIQFYTVAIDSKCEWSLIVYLAHFPSLYKCLSDETKIQIDKHIESNYNGKLISWFKHNDLIEHTNYLISEPKHVIEEQTIDFMKKTYSENGNLSFLFDFFIECFGESCCFDTADERFELIIKPHLNAFSNDQFDVLFRHIDNNYQIYGRRTAYSSNTFIIKTYIKKNKRFDSEKYTNIKYDESILSETARNEFIVEGDSLSF